MPDTNGYTVKEIVTEIKNTLNEHIEKTDTRLDYLEGESKILMGVVKFAGWVIGSSGLIGGLIFIINQIGE